MKKNFAIIALITLIMMSCSKRKHADLIITNATIYTVNSSFTVAQSMAVVNGKVAAIGTTESILNEFQSDSILDFSGLFVYPGFIDAHCHFLGYGLNLPKAQLSGAKTWDEVVKRLEANQQQYPTTWVEGRGWNQNEWNVKEFPTNELLNRMFPNKPVFIVRIDGHAAVANDKALEIAGIKANTKVEGGEIIVKNNKPTGVLLDNAMEIVRRCIPKPNGQTKANALLNAQKNCFAVGLTGVQDAGLDADEVALIDSLQQAGKLKMRINAMLNPTPENFEKYISKGIFKTNRLTIRSIKIYADGALGSRGAFLLKPYSDDLKNFGIQVETTKKLDSICKMAFDHGYQVCTHCIGDAAVRQMLDIYSKYLTKGNDLRWRIEHSQVVDPNDLPRYGQYGVIPSVQTTHATSDMFWADERLGNRIKYAYAYQDLLKQNGWLPNGSDFPIENINPLYGLYAGVARKNLQGEPANGFQPENALTREQALRAMTIWAAKACFNENEKGSLEPEKFADFVVLNVDLMKQDIDQIPKTKILRTYVNGDRVF
ncbi:MAG TPA: amidohydrolase [Tenuifilaceae bacterium]|nr:amidohydrolase [Tenuifilaceae bacterium]